MDANEAAVISLLEARSSEELGQKFAQELVKDNQATLVPPDEVFSLIDKLHSTSENRSFLTFWSSLSSCISQDLRHKFTSPNPADAQHGVQIVERVLMFAIDRLKTATAAVNTNRPLPPYASVFSLLIALVFRWLSFSDYTTVNDKDILPGSDVRLSLYRNWLVVVVQTVLPNLDLIRSAEAEYVRETFGSSWTNDEGETRLLPTHQVIAAFVIFNYLARYALLLPQKKGSGDNILACQKNEVEIIRIITTVDVDTVINPLAPIAAHFIGIFNENASASTNAGVPISAVLEFLAQYFPVKNLPETAKLTPGPIIDSQLHGIWRNTLFSYPIQLYDEEDETVTAKTTAGSSSRQLFDPSCLARDFFFTDFVFTEDACFELTHLANTTTNNSSVTSNLCIVKLGAEQNTQETHFPHHHHRLLIAAGRRFIASSTKARDSFPGRILTRCCLLQDAFAGTHAPRCCRLRPTAVDYPEPERVGSVMTSSRVATLMTALHDFWFSEVQELCTRLGTSQVRFAQLSTIARGYLKMASERVVRMQMGARDGHPGTQNEDGRAEGKEAEFGSRCVAAAQHIWMSLHSTTWERLGRSHETLAQKAKQPTTQSAGDVGITVNSLLSSMYRSMYLLEQVWTTMGVGKSQSDSSVGSMMWWNIPWQVSFLKARVPELNAHIITQLGGKPQGQSIGENAHGGGRTSDGYSIGCMRILETIEALCQIPFNNNKTVDGAGFRVDLLGLLESPGSADVVRNTVNIEKAVSCMFLLASADVPAITMFDGAVDLEGHTNRGHVRLAWLEVKRIVHFRCRDFVFVLKAIKDAERRLEVSRGGENLTAHANAVVMTAPETVEREEGEEGEEEEEEEEGNGDTLLDMAQLYAQGAAWPVAVGGHGADGDIRSATVLPAGGIEPGSAAVMGTKRARAEYGSDSDHRPSKRQTVGSSADKWRDTSTESTSSPTTGGSASTPPQANPLILPGLLSPPPHKERQRKQVATDIARAWTDLLSFVLPPNVFAACLESLVSNAYQPVINDADTFHPTQQPQKTTLDHVLTSFLVLHPQFVSSVLGPVCRAMMKPTESSAFSNRDQRNALLTYNKRGAPFYTLLDIFHQQRLAQSRSETSSGTAADTSSTADMALDEDESREDGVGLVADIADDAHVCLQILKFLTIANAISTKLVSSNKTSLHSHRGRSGRGGRGGNRARGGGYDSGGAGEDSDGAGFQTRNAFIPWIADCLSSASSEVRRQYFVWLVSKIDEQQRPFSSRGSPVSSGASDGTVGNILSWDKKDLVDPAATLLAIAQERDDSEWVAMIVPIFMEAGEAVSSPLSTRLLSCRALDPLIESFFVAGSKAANTGGMPAGSGGGGYGSRSRTPQQHSRVSKCVPDTVPAYVQELLSFSFGTGTRKEISPDVDVEDVLRILDKLFGILSRAESRNPISGKNLPNMWFRDGWLGPIIMAMIESNHPSTTLAAYLADHILSSSTWLPSLLLQTHPRKNQHSYDATTGESAAGGPLSTRLPFGSGMAEWMQTLSLYDEHPNQVFILNLWAKAWSKWVFADLVTDTFHEQREQRHPQQHLFDHRLALTVIPYINRSSDGIQRFVEWMMEDVVANMVALIATSISSHTASKPGTGLAGLQHQQHQTSPVALSAKYLDCFSRFLDELLAVLIKTRPDSSSKLVGCVLRAMRKYTASGTDWAALLGPHQRCFSQQLQPQPHGAQSISLTQGTKGVPATEKKLTRLLNSLLMSRFRIALESHLTSLSARIAEENETFWGSDGWFVGSNLPSPANSSHNRKVGGPRSRDSPLQHREKGGRPSSPFDRDRGSGSQEPRWLKKLIDSVKFLLDLFQNILISDSTKVHAAPETGHHHTTKNIGGSGGNYGKNSVHQMFLTSSVFTEHLLLILNEIWVDEVKECILDLFLQLYGPYHLLQTDRSKENHSVREQPRDSETIVVDMDTDTSEILVRLWTGAHLPTLVSLLQHKDDRVSDKAYDLLDTLATAFCGRLLPHLDEHRHAVVDTTATTPTEKTSPKTPGILLDLDRTSKSASLFLNRFFSVVWKPLEQLYTKAIEGAANKANAAADGEPLLSTEKARGRHLRLLYRTMEIEHAISGKKAFLEVERNLQAARNRLQQHHMTSDSATHHRLVQQQETFVLRNTSLTVMSTLFLHIKRSLAASAVAVAPLNVPNADFVDLLSAIVRIAKTEVGHLVLKHALRGFIDEHSEENPSAVGTQQDSEREEGQDDGTFPWECPSAVFCSQLRLILTCLDCGISIAGDGISGDEHQNLLRLVSRVLQAMVSTQDDPEVEKVATEILEKIKLQAIGNRATSAAAAGNHERLVPSELCELVCRVLDEDADQNLTMEKKAKLKNIVRDLSV
ncbi:hypothetical protein HK102_011769 [Quaeritorhiza haematococci]|nr:hypothetical protein HK102_011769 [Quaeritorhiza haematococci]